MRDEQVPTIKRRTRAVEKAFDDFLKFLGQLSDVDGRAFDLSRPIPTTDSSVSELRARTAAVAGLIRKFDDKGAALTPLADFVALNNSGNAVINALTQATEALSAPITNHGGLQAIDYDSFTFNTTNGNAFPLQGNFKTVFDSIESYILAFQQVFQAVSPSRASFNFSSAVDALSKIIGRTNETRDALQQNLSAAKKELGRVSENRAAFDAVIDDVRAKQELLDKQSSQAAEALTSISSRNDEANNLANATNELKDRVLAYQGDFDAFQSQLDAMKETFAVSDSNLQELIGRFEAQATSFDGLIEKSNQMLTASTVAGLASEFGTIRNDLDSKLTDAHRSFNWSIIFLAISALPLVLFVFAPFLVAILPENKNLVGAISGMAAEQNSWHYLGQVLARFVILFPAI